MDESLWRAVIDAHAASLTAQQRFVTECSDPLPLFRRSLADPRERRWRMFLRHQPDSVRLVLLDALLDLATVGHREIGMVRDVILAMPRDAVRIRWAERQEELLRDAGEEEYRRLLELLEHLDADACRQLAQRASQHDDEEIREAGTDFLERLSSR